MIAALALGALGQDRYERNFLAVGRPAPEFELPALAGRPITLKGREDVKAVVIIFWSLGGEASLPGLTWASTLAERHRGDVRVIAINHADLAEQIQPFWSANNLKIPCALNKPPDHDAIRAYGVAGYPSVYVLDSGYRVALAKYAPRTADIAAKLASLGISTAPR